MQPSYGVPNIHHNHLQNQQQQQLQFMEVNECCFPVSSPQNLNHLFYSNSQHQNQRQNQPQIHLQNEHRQQFGSIQKQEERMQIRTGQQINPSFFTVNFKLGLNENSGQKESALNQEEGPPNSLVMPHSWHTQQDSIAIKEPFWKLLNRSSNKLLSEDGEQEFQGSMKKYTKALDDGTSEMSKDRYKLSGELEAIYSLAKIGETNQTASGSALTGENSPADAGLWMPYDAIHGQNAAAIDASIPAIGVDRGSENSIGEEACLRKSQKRKRRKKMKEKLGSVACFFENLVKQVMDHQDMLHKKFVEVIERIDKERIEREEEWRRQEVVKCNRENISRAHEQALSLCREAQIVSYIEKITGQRIDLPARSTLLFVQPEILNEPTKELTTIKTDNYCRWPKAEVEALIQVRSSIETKFQEPGLKGPLWEEVSSLMCAMGYQRSAKRCKEKWENINKYFRKAKESTKKRSQQSKTCSYFDQLNQLYSRTLINCPLNSSSMPLCTSEIFEKHGYSELLEAFIAGRDLASVTNPTGESIRLSELNCSRLEFECVSEKNVDHEQGNHKLGKDHQEENEEDGSN